MSEVICAREGCSGVIASKRYKHCSGVCRSLAGSIDRATRELREYRRDPVRVAVLERELVALGIVASAVGDWRACVGTAQE
jgi:hypothetical protein